MTLPEGPLLLAEVAEKWSKTEEDIIRWIISGHLAAVCWYDGEGFDDTSGLSQFVDAKKGKAEAPVPNVYYTGWCFPDSLALGALLIGREATPLEITPYGRPGIDNNYILGGATPRHLGPGEALPKFSPVWYESTKTGYTITKGNLCIFPEETARFEAEHQELTQTAITREAQTLTPKPEAPLIGVKEIASYLTCSGTTVKNRMKTKAFPYHKEGGRVIAYPSELDSWRKKQRPKKKK